MNNFFDESAKKREAIVEKLADSGKECTIIAEAIVSEKVSKRDVIKYVTEDECTPVILKFLKENDPRMYLIEMDMEKYMGMVLRFIDDDFFCSIDDMLEYLPIRPFIIMRALNRLLKWGIVSQNVQSGLFYKSLEGTRYSA